MIEEFEHWSSMEDSTTFYQHRRKKKIVSPHCKNMLHPCSSHTHFYSGKATKSGKMQRLREVDVEIKHMLASLYGPFVLQTHSNQGLQAESGSSCSVKKELHKSHVIVKKPAFSHVKVMFMVRLNITFTWLNAGFLAITWLLCNSFFTEPPGLYLWVSCRSWTRRVEVWR